MLSGGLRLARSHEGRLMRLAESHGVAREDFLKNYQGSELDPRWLNRVSKLSAKGWKSMVAKDQDTGVVIHGRFHRRIRSRQDRERGRELSWTIDAASPNLRARMSECAISKLTPKPLVC